MKGTTYRGVIISPNWRMTSKNPGTACLSRFEQATVIASLEDVLSYENNDVVARIARDLDISLEKGGELFMEVKRFLWLASQKSEEKNGLIPTPIIDEAWHAFVLFTEDYAEFCEKFFGRFLHHVPHRVGEAQLDQTALHQSIDAMHECFGGKPNAYWDFGSVREHLATV